MILVWICVLLTISSTIKGSPLPQVLRDSNVSGGILKLKMPLHVFIYRTIVTIKFAGQIYQYLLWLEKFFYKKTVKFLPINNTGDFLTIKSTSKSDR